MVWTIIIIAILLVFVFASSSKKTSGHASSSGQRQVNMDVPNPETANPKKVIHFISNYDKDVVQQVYNQFKGLNIHIPQNLDNIFREKIAKGYIFKEDYYWQTSIEDFQIEHENLNNFSKTHSFDLKGVHVSTYKKNLKDCILFEMVTLKKDPNNKYDKNAIRVIAGNRLIGHVDADETETVHEIMTREHKAFISDILDLDGYLDVTIKIYYN
ncbi:MAG: hypothetical protein JST34_11175 [Bacteroidetes bacterium]|nr:hypothetical protein [Bacteroidota bacterium]